MIFESTKPVFHLLQLIIKTYKMSSLTNFEKVKEFNTAFDMVRSCEPNRTIFDTDPNTVDLRIKLIREEFEEFVVRKTKDFGEARDAIADMLYVVYGAADAFGIRR